MLYRGGEMPERQTPLRWSGLQEAQSDRRQKESVMTDKQSDLGASWWAKNLEDVDREVARLATICNVRILDPGVIERVLENDSSVCGSANPPAFAKLRSALVMHYHIRDKTVGAIGETQTALIIAKIVERLQGHIGKRLGGQLPGE
jgi:hypothetical protein